jgi:uncharacterized protein (DUF58 family)
VIKPFRAFLVRSLRQRATWSGLLFTLGTAFAGSFAFATGNNVLFLMLGLLLALLLISGMLNRLNLTAIEVKILPSEQVFANASTLITILVKNNKSWIDGFGLHVDGQDILNLRTFVEFVPRKKSVSQTVAATFSARGVYQKNIGLLWSRFPFGFTVRFEPLSFEQPVTIFPALLADRDLQQINEALDNLMDAKTNSAGDDWKQIRPLITGEAWNRVDWKAYARSGSLQVRDYLSASKPVCRVVLDRTASANFEVYVSAAATTLLKCHQRNLEVELVSDEIALTIADSTGLYTGFSYLATVQAVKSGSSLARSSSEVFLSRSKELAVEILFGDDAPDLGRPRLLWSRK